MTPEAFRALCDAWGVRRVGRAIGRAESTVRALRDGTASGSVTDWLARVEAVTEDKGGRVTIAVHAPAGEAGRPRAAG
jgi:hypothetical protein